MAAVSVTIASVSDTGANGTASWGSGSFAEVRVLVTGEGAFEVRAPVTMTNGGQWSVKWPAKLATGSYSVTAQLLRPISHTSTTLTVNPPPPPPPPPSGQLFAPSAYVNVRKANPVWDPNSAAIVSKLAQAGGTAWVSMDSGSTSYYVKPADPVAAGWKRVHIVHTVPGGTGRNIQAALDLDGGRWVPPNLTSDVIRNGNDIGRDGHVVIIDGDDYGEYYQLRIEGGVYKTSTAGLIRGISTHLGFFRDGPDWPTGSYHTWGDTGSSIPVMAGTITIAEWQQALADEKAGKGGVIPHELALDLPAGYVGSGWVWPAQRTDGSAGGGLPIEGDLFLLDPAYNVGSLGNAQQRLVARTLQQYGARLRDRSQVLGLYMEDPYAKGHDGNWVINTLFEGHWPGTNSGGWLQTNGGFPWGSCKLVKRCPINTNDSVPTPPCS